MDDGHLALRNRPLCRGVVIAAPRLAVADHIWKRGAVHRAAVCQLWPADECWHPALAPESLLDADLHELHALDVWAIPVDLLRGLPSQASPSDVSGGRSLFPPRHSHDGGAGAAARQETRGTSCPPRILGFRAIAD